MGRRKGITSIDSRQSLTYPVSRLRIEGRLNMGKFQLKELSMMALIVASIFVLGYLLLPLMQMLPLPALRALLVAPIYASGVTLLTRKIDKFGTVTMLGLVIGALLSVFFIWMLIISLIGGFLTDVVIRLIFKGYASKRSIWIASGLFPALQLPLAFIMVAYTIGGPSGELIRHPLVVTLPTLVTFGLGYFTSKGLDRILSNRGL